LSFSDNAEQQRFELLENGLTAFATYRRRGDTIVIPHVEAPVPLRGTGAAGRLMAAIADYAREHELTIAPLCPYARSWFRRHPDRADLLV
jgi:hypothetical protein